MAGGMSSGGGLPIGQRRVIMGETVLADRSDGPSDETTDPSAAGVSQAAGEERAVRRGPVGRGAPARHPHVWFVDPRSGARYPALVVEQARGPDGWLACVVHLVTDDHGATWTVHGWVAARDIEPLTP